MEDHESRETQTETETRGADRRSFMKTAVKTVVAGAAVAGVAGAVGKAEAATCGGLTPVPKAVVKAHVRFNNQAQIKRQDIINVLNGIFDSSVCPTCGLGGFGPWDPGTVLEITFGTAFMGGDQLSNVMFEQVGGGF